MLFTRSTERAVIFRFVSTDHLARRARGTSRCCSRQPGRFTARPRRSPTRKLSHQVEEKDEPAVSVASSLRGVLRDAECVPGKARSVRDHPRTRITRAHCGPPTHRPPALLSLRRALRRRPIRSRSPIVGGKKEVTRAPPPLPCLLFGEQPHHDLTQPTARKRTWSNSAILLVKGCTVHEPRSRRSCLRRTRSITRLAETPIGEGRSGTPRASKLARASVPNGCEQAAGGHASREPHEHLEQELFRRPHARPSTPGIRAKI